MKKSQGSESEFKAWGSRGCRDGDWVGKPAFLSTRWSPLSAVRLHKQSRQFIWNIYFFRCNLSIVLAVNNSVYHGKFDVIFVFNK